MVKSDITHWILQVGILIESQYIEMPNWHFETDKVRCDHVLVPKVNFDVASTHGFFNKSFQMVVNRFGILHLNCYHLNCTTSKLNVQV